MNTGQKMFLKRQFCSRPKVSLNEDVFKSITNSEYKPRKHPGVNQSKTITLPDNFLAAVQKVFADYSIKTFWDSAQRFNRYLKSRHPPMENKDIKKVIKTARQDVVSSIDDIQINSDEDYKRVNQSINDKVTNVLKSKVYNWQPINYDLNNSLIYLLARSAQEYAVLFKIMNEITLQDPTFQPRSMFDFGSGVGMGTWAAASFWKKYIYEYFNVDISRDMHDLAEVLLQGGSTTGNKELKGVFYRQFLPASKNTYDLVICSYSLLELPSLKSRMEMILNLWNKTENYFIVVEQGTKPGFKVINEIRDFVLQLNEGKCGGYVFSPCPHDYICPKYVNDKQNVCNFPVQYFPLPMSTHKQVHYELYSYVIFKKGCRNSNSPEWPRLVEPTLVRSKHSICRMCTSDGKLKEIIFSSSKHGKPLYYCAKKTQWGDRLPVIINDENVT